jgi:putative ABC transport system ATP-binding protein
MTRSVVPTSQDQWVIEAKGLTKVYPMGSTRVHALRGVSLRVARGEFVALMGSSGSGKSTLMHLLGCLDTPTSGTYLLEGRDVSGLPGDARAKIRNERVGFVFQTFNLLPRLSALDNVALPLLYRGHAGNVRQQATMALDRVGLAHRTDHRPVEMSGGERQRVAIARALIAEPAVILADEPTGNLDSETGAAVMDLLAALHADGRTVLVVTHDTHVGAYAQRIVRIKDGRIVDRGESDVLA